MSVPSTIAIVALAAIGVVGLAALPSRAADAPSPVGSRTPNCANREPQWWVTSASHPNDGVPDPAGRIVFGQLIRDDDNLGQLVRLYAIDPDGSDLVQLLDCE